jgi:hypothetical protein
MMVVGFVCSNSKNVVGHQSNKVRNISSVDGEGLYPVFESWLRIYFGVWYWAVADRV